LDLSFDRLLMMMMMLQRTDR